MSRAEWNHAPEGAIAVSPLRPVKVLKWYAAGWLPLSINLSILALAFLSWVYLSPTLDTAQGFGPWVLGIWARNAVITVAVAGSLHLWFHAYALQGTRLKYDPRPFPRRGRVFSFSDQLKDNLFWTLVSGVTVWSALVAAVWWELAKGLMPRTTFAQTPVWFIAFFFFIPVWESLYFYWIHRLLHTRVFYRFHALHHLYSEVNYGNLDVPWDKLFGSFHDGTDAGKAQMRERLKNRKRP